MGATEAADITVVTLCDIVAGLRELGLGEGDTVLVHSSLSSFGHVEGGADTVIDAILAVIGETGTTMAPNSPATWPAGDTHYDFLGRQLVFDVRGTPSGLGRITEVLRCRPDARRSLSACHSVAALGARRDWLIEGHERCTGPAGPGTPYWKNCQIGGKVLLIGVTQVNNTTIHTIEETAAPVPFLTGRIFHPQVVDYEGKLLTLSTRAHTPSIPRDYPKIEPVLQEHGAITMCQVGQSTLRLMDAAALLEIGVRLLTQDPLYLAKRRH